MQDFVSKLCPQIRERMSLTKSAFSTKLVLTTLVTGCGSLHLYPASNFTTKLVIFCHSLGAAGSNVGGWLVYNLPILAATSKCMPEIDRRYVVIWKKVAFDVQGDY